MSASRHERNFLKTLARGLSVLGAFTPDRPTLTLTELSEVLQLDPGTVHRFTYTLEHLGYLRRDRATRAYRLTSRVLDLGRSVHQQEELCMVARPFMEELARNTEESVSLAVRDGLDIIVLAEVESPQPVTIRGWAGNRYPCYCTAQGKVLLAYLPKAEQAQLMNWMHLKSYGPTTIVDHTVLRAELDRIADQGFAFHNDEMAAGFYAIAAPVRSASGAVAASIALATPTGRMSLTELDVHFRPGVVGCADQISKALANPSTAALDQHQL